MEENIMNEVVEKAEEQLYAAAENLDKAIADQKALTPVQPVAQPISHGPSNILKGAGLTLGGVGIGIAIDRWVIPAVQKGIENVKAKRAAKKAAKKAKAEAKKAAKEQKPATPAPEAPAANDGIDPNTVDTKID